jgi:hypothetical protein
MTLRKLMQKDKREEFVELTEKALLEEDGDRMIELLQAREVARQHMMVNDIDLREKAKEYLSRETKILERLEDEKKKLLKEMENISRKKSAAKTYAPTFPFPPMPAFFDKKG